MFVYVLCCGVLVVEWWCVLCGVGVCVFWGVVIVCVVEFGYVWWFV